jgi:hypothetical protein
MKKTIKRKRKDMRVYKDQNGKLSVVSVFYDSKNNLIDIGDVEMAVGDTLTEIKRQLFSMFKATRLEIIDDQYLEKILKQKK